MLRNMKLNLIVLRSQDMELLAAFYSALFEKKLEKHRHGDGPEHFGAELNGLIFEIYPKRNDADDTAPMRFGYLVDNVETALERIREFPICIVSEPKESPWGKRVVLDDPAGHRIELTQAKTASHPSGGSSLRTNPSGG